MKVCISCNINKELTLFSRNSKAIDGLQSYCKSCAKNKQLEWCLRNPDKKKASDKKYYNKKIEAGLIIPYNFRRKLTKEERTEKQRQKRLGRLAKDPEYDKRQYNKHRSKKLAGKKKYYIENKEKINNRNCVYVLDRRKKDLNYNLKHTLAARIRGALKRLLQGKLKYTTSGELLGCSIEELKKHLEMQFKDGMNWDNHSIHGWHIDHIKPLSSFDLTNIEQQKIAFNYKNLQPLWAFDNLSKSDKEAA